MSHYLGGEKLPASIVDVWDNPYPNILRFMGNELQGLAPDTKEAVEKTKKSAQRRFEA